MSRGAGVAGVGLGLCALAGAFGARALYVPGLALLLISVSAPACVWLAARRAQISREPQRATVEEGIALELRARANRVRSPLGGAEVSRGPDSGFIPLGRLPEGKLAFAVRLPRRGAHVVGPSELRFRDPFNVCARTLRSAPTEVLVLPRVDRLDARRLAPVLAAQRGASMRGRHGPETADVDGLRPYRQGAPASRIHWPTVARTGTLLERRLETASDRAPLVVLDSRRPADADTLDKAVRAAASLCIALARHGGCSLLLPNGRPPVVLSADLIAWPALHTRLALVQAGGALLWGPAERAATVLWVTASAQPDARALRGGASTLLVSPFRDPGAAVLLEVAGCTVQRAGRRLPRAVA